jgi:signal transduction histidine kinase
MFRAMKTYQLVVDALIAVAFHLVLVVAGGFGIGGRTAEYAVLVGMTVALALRRFSPIGALVVSWITALAQMYYFGLQPGPANLAILAVLFSTAAYGNRAVKWLGLISAILGALLGSAYLVFGDRAYLFGLNYDFNGITNAGIHILQFAFLLVAMAVLLGLPWTAGLLVRTRVLARESREARAVAQREVDIAEQDVIVEQERNRIARDMHDVVAHSLAVVIAQADGARYAHKFDPGAVDGALIAISSTARDALADVRLLLGQLRHSQSEGPQPGLDDLERLFDQLRASGLTIRFERRGTPLALGIAHQLAAYRIVQEALINALRHADASKEVVVKFAWTGNALEVTIRSALVSSPATAELRMGHGLAGMKERAALVGGKLTTDIDAESFVVRAHLPASATAPTPVQR